VAETHPVVPSGVMTSSHFSRSSLMASRVDFGSDPSIRELVAGALRRFKASAVT
jgi:hypothetical protein